MAAMTIVLKILGMIISPILTLLIGFLAAKLRENKKAKEDSMKEIADIKESVKLILLRMLQDDHAFYGERGYCPIGEKAEVQKVYDCYHNLGGNGMGTQMRTDIIELPDSKPRK